MISVGPTAGDSILISVAFSMLILLMLVLSAFILKAMDSKGALSIASSLFLAILSAAVLALKLLLSATIILSGG